MSVEDRTRDGIVHGPRDFRVPSTPPEGNARARRLMLISGLFLLACFSFFLGVVVGTSNYGSYRELQDIFRTWRETGGLYRTGSWFRVPVGTPREFVTVYRDAADVMPGYRAILLYIPASKAFAVWLIDKRGSTLHSWPVDYALLRNENRVQGDDEPHGFLVMKDGSILLNFDHGQALARLDSCGQALWVLRAAYHHMINFTEDGNIIVWRGENTAYGDQQFIDTIDPDTGDVLRTISLEEVLARSAETHVINFRMPLGYQFKRFTRRPPSNQDHFHPNDVEVLTARMAGAFPGFAAGDLLLSFHEQNLIAVLDGQSGKIKWSQSGPWHRQHDPDFQPDGTITVYDNNLHPGLLEDRRSSIIAINPEDRQAWRLFTDGNLSFYSGWGGEHQLLPNGTWQVVVPIEGRVVEVDKYGHVVWEFNNVMSEDLNAYVLNGTWLPENYFNSFPSCAKS